MERERYCFKLTVASNFCNRTLENDFVKGIARGKMLTDDIKFEEKLIVAYPFELRDMLHLCKGWSTE